MQTNENIDIEIRIAGTWAGETRETMMARHDEEDPIVTYCWPAVPRVGDIVNTPRGLGTVRLVAWGPFVDQDGHPISRSCDVILSVELTAQENDEIPKGYRARHDWIGITIDRLTETFLNGNRQDFVDALDHMARPTVYAVLAGCCCGPDNLRQAISVYLAERA